MTVLILWGLLLIAIPLLGQQEQALDSIPMSITFDETVVVTGQYAPTELQATSLPVKVISSKVIAQRAALSMTELLQQEANIRLYQDPVLGTSITMNGLGGQHIKILVDGVPMIGRQDGNIDLDRIPLQSIERIEIVQNAMSVVYGTNALGGTINIITKKEQEETWDLRLLGQTQSNTQSSLGADLNYQWKGFSAGVNYQWNHFNGFSTDTLRSQQWNPKKQHQLQAKAYYQLPKSNLQLGYRFGWLSEQVQDLGVTKLGAFPSLTYAKDYEFVSNSQDHSVVALGYLDAKKRYYLDVVGAYNHYQREKNGYFRSLKENPEQDTLDALDSDTSSFEAFSLRATISAKFSPKFQAQIGTEWRYDWATGARLEEDAQLLDAAGFATIQYRPLTKLTIDAGLRMGYNSLGLLPFTYTLGVQWKLADGMPLRLNYARGIRTPSLKERYLEFLDINHHIVGNPDLRAEYAHNLRLNWSYSKVLKGGHLLRTELSAFYNYIQDQINLYSYSEDSLGNFVADLSSNQFTYFNLDVFQNAGIQADLKYEYKGLRIQLSANFTGLYNNLHESYETAVPPFTTTFEFSQEISYHFKKIDLQISLFRRDYDRQLRFAATTNPFTQETEIQQLTINGYGLMDLTLSKGFFNGALRLGAGVKNLFDVTEIGQQGGSATAHGGGGSSLPVGMGRVFFVRLEFLPFLLGKEQG